LSVFFEDGLAKTFSFIYTMNMKEPAMNWPKCGCPAEICRNIANS